MGLSSGHTLALEAWNLLITIITKRIKISFYSEFIDFMTYSHGGGLLMEDECMVQGCNRRVSHRVVIGGKASKKALYVCETCATDIKHPQKLSAEPL